MKKNSTYKEYLERQIKERSLIRNATKNYKRENCKTSFGPEEDDERIQKERENTKKVNQIYVSEIEKQLKEKEKIKTRLLIQKLKDTTYISDLVNKEQETKLETRQQQTSRMYIHQ